MASSSEGQPWFLKLEHPVLFPEHNALSMSDAEFNAFITAEIKRRHETTANTCGAAVVPATVPCVKEPSDAALSAAFDDDSTTADIRNDLSAAKLDAEETRTGSAFMDALHGVSSNLPAYNMENMMHTENGDMAYRSTINPLVDLFAELEYTVTGPRLRELLESAWASDPEMTLKIIFNSRSIPLGKSSRVTFYRCAGWLSQNHPLTLIANFRWITRPIIQKKVVQAAEGDGDDDDMVLVEEERASDDHTRFDMRNGVAHGYWKDLLNMLALAANKQLHVLSEPSAVLNICKETPNEDQKLSVTEASEQRQNIRKSRHENALVLFDTSPVYRAMHLTIARLFADQLAKDLAALRGTDVDAKRHISLCGKWAPSHDRFHDKHTFIVSSIAEILHPRELLKGTLGDLDNREIYLRYARDAYRKDLAALRKYLDVLERKLTTREYGAIKYDRIPSLALSKNSKTFIAKDYDRFSDYAKEVAAGRARISGATLMPSTLVREARGIHIGDFDISQEVLAQYPAKALARHKEAKITVDVVNGQWATLVRRIKDSGSLSSSIAVCDVSGSMTYPPFADRTVPIDSAIGLSLLLSEVTEAPFGSSIITFSEVPTVHKIDPKATFTQKVQDIIRTTWAMNTDFVAVFEKLILPMAQDHTLTNDQMVKRVFVFSDMQFDAAQPRVSFDIHDSGTHKLAFVPEWGSSYQRIKAKFIAAGYDMPELIFWNLAGGKGSNSDATAPKPVMATDEGTSLVSGYSQGLLKVFLDGGNFADVEEDSGDNEDEVLVTKVEGEDGFATSEPVAKKAKTDPTQTLKKAVGHKAYDMLTVVD